MKKKKLWIAISAILLCVIAVAVAAAVYVVRAEAFELEDGAEQIWMDRYDEKTILLKSGNAEKLNWVSSDKNVVTVDKGRLSAEGVGKATITVFSGLKKETVNVSVNDSGNLPVIECQDFDAYQDAEIEIPAAIKYNGEITDIKADYTAEIISTAVAEYADGKIKGISLGETSAIIKTDYKGLHLEKSVKITVKENSLVDFGQTEVEIYSAQGNAKLNSATLAPKVVKNGKVLEDAKLTYEAVEGTDCIVLEDAKVIAVKEGTATVKATYEDKDVTLEGTVTVKVKPNWVASGFTNGSLYPITWQPASGTIGGRQAEGTDMMEYRAADLSNSSYWEHRVSGNDTDTLLADLYRKGYRYFAYDVYYGSDANFYMGTGRGPQTVYVGEYFRRNYVKVLSDENGDGKLEVTNRVEKNKWMTFVFDLLTLIEDNPNVTSEFFFTVNDSTTSSYVMNVRYYLDDTSFPKENLVYTDEGDYVQATLDEFAPFIPVSSGYAKLKTEGKYEAEVKPGQAVSYGAYSKKAAGRTGVYRYQANSDYQWINNLVVASSMNKSYDLGMLNLSKRGRYLTFDIYVENADTISISINHTGRTASITLGKTDLSKWSKWLKVYKDGKLQYTMQKGNWYTVSLGYIDGFQTGAWRSTILVGGCKTGDVFYLDNVRYYKNKDFLPTEWDGVAPPQGMETIHPDTTLESVTSGTFKGTAKYTSKNSGLTWDNHWASIMFPDVTSSNTKDGGKGVASFFKGGYKYVKLDIYLAENTQGFGYFSWATNKSVNYEGVKYDGELMVGDSNFTTLLFDAATKQYATKVEANKWYTLFIPVEYSNSAVPQWALVEFRSIGGSAENPAVVYLRNLEFTKTAYTYNASETLIAPKLAYVSNAGYPLLQILAGRNVKTDIIVNHDDSNPIAVTLEPSGIAYEALVGLNKIVNQCVIGKNTLTVRLTDGGKTVETSIEYDNTGFLYVRDPKGTLETIKDGGETVLKYSESYKEGEKNDWTGFGSTFISCKKGDQENVQGGFATKGVKYMTMDVKLLDGTGLEIFYGTPKGEEANMVSANIKVGETSKLLISEGAAGTLENDKWVTVKIPLAATNAEAPYRNFTVQPTGVGSALLIKNVRYETGEYKSPASAPIVKVNYGQNQDNINVIVDTNAETKLIINGDTENPITLSMEAGTTGYETTYSISNIISRLKIGENTLTVSTADGGSTSTIYNNKGYLYARDPQGTLETAEDGDDVVLKYTAGTDWRGVGSTYISRPTDGNEDNPKQGGFAVNGVKYMTMKVKLVKGTGLSLFYDVSKQEPAGNRVSASIKVGETSIYLDKDGYQETLKLNEWITVKIPLATVEPDAPYRNFTMQPTGGEGSILLIKDVQYLNDTYTVPQPNPLEATIAASSQCEEIEIVAQTNMSTTLIVNGNEDHPITITLEQNGTEYVAWFKIRSIINQLKLGENILTVRATDGATVFEKDVTYVNTGFMYVYEGKHTLELVTDEETGETVLKFTETDATGTIWNGVRSKYIAYNNQNTGSYGKDGITYISMEVKLTTAEGIMVSYAGPGGDTAGDVWRSLNLGASSDIIDNNGVQGTVVLNEWMTIKVPLKTNGTMGWRNFYVKPKGNNGVMYIRNVQYCTDEYVAPSVPLMMTVRENPVLAVVFNFLKQLKLGTLNK